MLDDIIEAAIDIFGDVLETVIHFRRRKAKKAVPEKGGGSGGEEPWTRSETAPWEK